MGSRGQAVVHRFFVEHEPHEGRVRLRPDEARHAEQVLRLRAGDEVLGLDGRGRAWPLRILGGGAGRRGHGKPLELEVSGEVSNEPAPGRAGAALPWIEVAVSLPKPGRAEDMVDRLTQLGVAAVRPLACERTQGAARELSPARLERLRRAAAQACKQCHRLWVPEVKALAPLGGGPDDEDPFASWRTGAFGDLEGALHLGDWARETAQSVPAATDGAALGLAVGPEGGWTPAERERLLGARLRPVRIAAHVLRVETAAEAALAIVAHAFTARAGAAD